VSMFGARGLALHDRERYSWQQLQV